MDIRTARTFLEVVNTGSFVRAASNLNITQTAVSARIKSLEDQLDRPLFVRNKAGARMTPAGEQFHPYAMTMVQLWERARHQVALPAGLETVVTIGSEYSLWDPLLREHLLQIRKMHPKFAVRVRIDVADRLISQIEQGLLDVALVYDPPHRPGLVSELLADETLVAVSTAGPQGATTDSDEVYVDWGTSFAVNHHNAFPNKGTPVVTVNHGPLGLDYIMAMGGHGYFRLAAVQQYLSDGKLHLMPNRPKFSYPIHAVYSSEADDYPLERLLAGLRTTSTMQTIAPASRTKRTYDVRNGSKPDIS